MSIQKKLKEDPAFARNSQIDLEAVPSQLEAERTVVDAANGEERQALAQSLYDRMLQLAESVPLPQAVSWLKMMRT